MRKLSIKDCHKAAAKKEGFCRETIYIDSSSPMHWECKEGHIWATNLNHIHRGTWCRVCAGDAKHDLTWLQKLAKEKEGFCHATEYKTNMTKYPFECKFGHKWEAKANWIQQGRWCAECAGLKRKDLNWLQCIAKEREGFCLATVYINNHTRYPFQCKFLHPIWMATPTNIQHGRTWCPTCAHTCSRAQIEIFNFVKNLYPDTCHRQKRLLRKKRYELDIWIPSLKIGIEYDGDLFWHSSRNINYKPEREKLKEEMCEEANILLIHIKETDYLKDKKEILQYLQTMLKWLRFELPEKRKP
jgi:hypothetical protein